jgi:hypothetical protein
MGKKKNLEIILIVISIFWPIIFLGGVLMGVLVGILNHVYLYYFLITLSIFLTTTGIIGMVYRYLKF